METKRSAQLRKIGHAASLLFGAWWLVATTAPYVPPRECFKGIVAPATLRVVLGERTPTVQGALPSCQGLDGLVPGAALTFILTRSTPTGNPNGRCLRWDSQTISGLQDVTVSNHMAWASQESLTAAGGQFVPAGSPDCQAGWHLQLSPEFPPEHDQLISPLDAGPSQRWFVARQMGTSAGALCASPLAGEAGVQCEDEFVVESITEVTP